MTDEDQQFEREMAAIEAFDPSQPLRKITLPWRDAGGRLQESTFIQGPLGHFQTVEFGNIIKRIVRDVMNGKYGVDVKELLKDRKKLSAAQAAAEHTHEESGVTHSHPINFAAMDEASLDVLWADHDIADSMQNQTAVNERLQVLHAHVEADMAAVYEQWKPYIEAFLEILGEVPEIEQDIMALSLGVRRRDREDFKEAISQAPHLGGLTNTQAKDILVVFIQQNVRQIRRFLGEELQEIGQALMDAVGEMAPGQDEPSSGTTASNTSSPPIPA